MGGSFLDKVSLFCQHAEKSKRLLPFLIHKALMFLICRQTLAVSLLCTILFSLQDVKAGEFLVKTCRGADMCTVFFGSDNRREHPRRWWFFTLHQQRWASLRCRLLSESNYRLLSCCPDCKSILSRVNRTWDRDIFMDAWK